MKVGVRGSKLALAYANKAIDAMGQGEIEIIKTDGDLFPDVPIHEIGGKGVFCSAIETALVNNEIDVAVHSLKDMPGDIEHPNLIVGAYLERSSPYDVILGKVFNGFTIGTSSPRRTKQLTDLYGHLNVKIKHIRGNIDTRLAKLDAGEYDALVLAEAGLQALSISRTTVRLPIVPAVGQGTIALQCRKDDVDTIEILKHADHNLTRRHSFLERSLLKGIMGNCSTKIAAYASEDNPIKLEAVYYD